jgi:hypothetical protein
MEIPKIGTLSNAILFAVSEAIEKAMVLDRKTFFTSALVVLTIDVQRVY